MSYHHDMLRRPVKWRCGECSAPTEENAPPPLTGRQAELLGAVAENEPNLRTALDRLRFLEDGQIRARRRVEESEADAPPPLTEEQLERLTTAFLAAGALDEPVCLPRRLVPAILARLDHLEAENERLQRANDEKTAAINDALDELGIPGPGYPAPVGEAVKHLRRVVLRHKGGEDG